MANHHPVPLRVLPSSLCATGVCHHHEDRDPCPTASITVCQDCTAERTDPELDAEFVSPVMWPCPPGRTAEAMRVAPAPTPQESP